MTELKDRMPTVSQRTRLGIGAAVLLGLGLAGGAGAVSLTRPSIEMAPAVVTPVGKLAGSSGIVTVKGKIVEMFGDRVVIEDQSGRTMIDADGRSDLGLAVGQMVTLQGRYDNGQMHASYLIDANGRVTAMGPVGGPPPGPGGPKGPHHEAPPPPHAGQDQPGNTPPPPAGCATQQPAPAAPANAATPQR